MVKILSEYKAVMFDLDDTLLDRDKAVGAMFSVIIKNCYSGVSSNEMLINFKRNDNKGYNNKITVLNNLFNEYPPDYRIPDSEIMDFWNANFPTCFSIDEERTDMLKIIVEHSKTAIVTNGMTEVQKAKIAKTELDKIFSVVVVSEEAGVSKPDSQIFDIALQKLGIEPGETLFVGDHLENDIHGSQEAGMNGIWYNPNKLTNDTNIIPFKEIHNLNQILPLIGADNRLKN